MNWLPTSPISARRGTALLGWSLLCAGREEDADRSLASALAEPGDDPPTSDLYALRAVAVENVDAVAALSLYGKALRHGMGARQVLQRLPRLLGKGLADVIATPLTESLRAAASSEEDRAAIDVGAGLIAAVQGRWDTVEVLLSSAMATNPGTAGQDARTAALATLAEVSDGVEGAAERISLARFLMELGDWQRAEQEAGRVHTMLEGISENDLVDAEACQLLGELAERQHQPVQAAQWYSAAGRLFLWREKWDRAASAVTTAVGLRPTAEDYWVLGEALRFQAMSGEATDHRGLDRALEAWDAGRRLEAPGPGEGWAYRSRSHICREMSSDRAEEASRWQWETVCDLERALVLDPADARALEYLGSAYLEAVLPSASEAAFDSQRALDPSIANEVVEVMNFARCLRCHPDDLDDLLARTSSPVVRVFLHLRRGEYDDALRLVAGSTEDELGGLKAQLKALLVMRAGLPDAAATIASIVEQGGLEVEQEAWAYVALGDAERAWARVKPALDRLPDGTADPVDTRVSAALALFLLDRGDEAERLVKEALVWTRALATVEEVLADLAMIRAPGRPPLSPAATVAWTRSHDTVESVAERFRSTGRGPAATQALDELEWVGNRPGPGHAARELACALGRGRTARTVGSPVISASVYAELLATGSDVPGLADLFAETVAAAGPSLLMATGGPRALGLLTTARDALPPDDPRREELRDVLDLGRLIGLGAEDPAVVARELSRRSDQALDRLRLSWLAHIPDTRAFWRVHDALAASPDPRLRALPARLMEWLHVTVLGPAPALPAPDPPIRLDVAPDLLPEDTSLAWVLLGKLLPELRERVYEETKLLLPGVRVGPLPADEERRYRVSVHGVERLSGTLAPEEEADPALVSAVERVVWAELVRLTTVVTTAITLERLVGTEDMAAAAQAVQNDPGALLRLSLLARTEVRAAGRVRDWSTLMARSHTTGDSDVDEGG
jgi:tetratricopeptide (TPR) repeat protein